MGKVLVGVVKRFFDKVGVAAIELNGALKVGDKISVEKGEAAEALVVEQVVESMQIDRLPIQSANAGQSVGIKLNGATREGAKVYRVEE
ncbi:hypothetical protein HY992_02915 [Candidatus Micrarchaeota archaeon]|nr:hypothetical protein [Candidatus Micrarchaeota archaeon]